MGKNKLERWRENETFASLRQPLLETLQADNFDLKGCWHRDFFANDNPITLELGCGRGEYTIEMARAYPKRNFVGIDIKGARLWNGAKTAAQEELPNAAFVRTYIELAERLFAAGEVSEVWLTFPDPQPSKCRRRLCSSFFMNRYRQFVAHGGAVHLKTDCLALHRYALALLRHNGVAPIVAAADAYACPALQNTAATAVQTAYEKWFRGQGSAITYLQFALPPDKVWTEPPDFVFDKNVPQAKIWRHR